MSRRGELRAQVWEISGGQCEHPIALTYRCTRTAAELAHIQPRGHGHTGYRDRLDNVMAACTVHAASTDDLSSPEWDHVPGWRVALPIAEPNDPRVAHALMTKRQALAHYVNKRRRREGVDLEASDAH